MALELPLSDSLTTDTVIDLKNRLKDEHLDERVIHLEASQLRDIDETAIFYLFLLVREFSENGRELRVIHMPGPLQKIVWRMGFPGLVDPP